MRASIINKAMRHATAFAGRFHFLRGNFRSLLAWPAGALVLALAGWSVVLTGLDADRRAVESNLEREAAALSKGYAGHLVRILETVDQTLLHVKYEWELSGGRMRLEDVGKKGLFPPTSWFNVGIIDASGMRVTSTIPEKVAQMRSNRPYFQAHKDSGHDFLYIGEPAESPSLGRYVLYFSRRIEGPDGKFNGVVYVAAALDYFTVDYDYTTLGTKGFLGMISSENGILATRVANDVYPPRDPALLAVPHFPAESGSFVLNGQEWFRDGRSRYLGWEGVDGYPLVALTGIDRQNGLAPFLATRAAAIRDAIWLTIALAAFTLIGMALSMRLAWRKHQLDLIQSTYRIATEGGTEGFYIARPVRDIHGAIVDFEVIDVNLRGAEFFGMRREELIGRRLSMLYEGAGPERAIQWLRQAMASGYFEGEVEVPAGSPVSARWVHLRAARSGDDLALTLRDISDTKAHVAELERRSNEDPLTGLPNRSWAQAYLPKALDRASREGAMLAILFIDLDGFKSVNDTMGHAAGDELLRIAARRLKVAVRPHDKVVRLGGDEFIVIIDHISDKADAAHVAARILNAFKEGVRLPEGVHGLGASIGISVFPADGADAATLLKNADIAMYAVKTSGKGNFGFYDEKFFESLRARMENEYELRRAIERDEFVMYYQPRVDIATGNTSSMEALVRWAHPVKGLTDPLYFIPLAEQTGLILGLGELIIDKVCSQLAQWAHSGRDLVPVSINVSPRQFDEADIARILATSLARHNVDPRLVEVELTESSMMSDNRDITGTLAAIRKMGIKLLVDDFGTGYSSLSQLQRLDFDILKVDRAFTAELDRTEQGNVFFTAIITMAHALGMRVVAEGVETEAQIRILQALHCDEIQGYYISIPLPPTDTQPVLPRMFFPPQAATHGA